MRNYHAKNRTVRLAFSASWYAKHKSEVLARRKRYWAANREDILARRRQILLEARSERENSRREEAALERMRSDSAKELEEMRANSRRLEQVHAAAH